MDVPRCNVILDCTALGVQSHSNIFTCLVPKILELYCMGFFIISFIDDLTFIRNLGNSEKFPFQFIQFIQFMDKHNMFILKHANFNQTLIFNIDKIVIKYHLINSQFMFLFLSRSISLLFIIILRILFTQLFPIYAIFLMELQTNK